MRNLLQEFIEYIILLIFRIFRKRATFDQERAGINFFIHILRSKQFQSLVLGLLRFPLLSVEVFFAELA